MSDTNLTKEHYHEMTDRLHVMCCMINDHLLEHSVAQQDEEINQPIKQALSVLYDTYQRAAGKLFEHE
jgi:hypothetical protein